jgi:hypothetical protein
MTGEPWITAILAIWVLAVFAWVIWTNRWIGCVQCVVVAVAAGLAVAGPRFGFDGNIAAIVFVALVVAVYFSARKILARRKPTKTN